MEDLSQKKTFFGASEKNYSDLGKNAILNIDNPTLVVFYNCNIQIKHKKHTETWVLRKYESLQPS